MTVEQPAMTPMSACLINNRRPKELLEYQAACRASEGDDVEELMAASVHPNMVIWHGGKWLVVKFKQTTGQTVIVDFLMEEKGATSTRFATLRTPMYRRVVAGNGKSLSQVEE